MPTCVIWSPSALGKCHAYFGFNKAGSDSSDTYNFYDYSQGNVKNWYWNFGDGTSSTERNPTHTFNLTYDTASTVMVCLTIVTDSCTNMECQTIFIRPQPPVNCHAYFGATIAGSDSSNTYNFYDYSQGNVNYWYWNFGDGTSSTERNPTHTFIYLVTPHIR